MKPYRFNLKPRDHFNILSFVALTKMTEYVFWCLGYFIVNSDGGVDPKSPIGTAAAFSKANKQALAIANHSLVYEFASLELLNQLSR